LLGVFPRFFSIIQTFDISLLIFFFQLPSLSSALWGELVVVVVVAVAFAVAAVMAVKNLQVVLMLV